MIFGEYDREMDIAVNRREARIIPPTRMQAVL